MYRYRLPVRNNTPDTDSLDDRPATIRHIQKPYTGTIYMIRTDIGYPDWCRLVFIAFNIPVPSQNCFVVTLLITPVTTSDDYDVKFVIE
jgi:hypothetical protein